MIKKFFKILNKDTSSILQIIQEGEYIPHVEYIPSNNSIIRSNNIENSFGIIVNDDIYALNDPFKDFPVCSIIQIDEDEYLYLKDLLQVEIVPEEESIDTEIISEVEDSYENYKNSNNQDIMNLTRDLKIKEMKSKCRQSIINGINVYISETNSVEHFDLTVEDQLNLNSLRYQTLFEDVEKLPLHCKDGEFKYYTVEDTSNVLNEMDKHILYHNSYFNSLKRYINNLTDYKQVNSIEYGDDIPEEYKSEILLSIEN